jgi:hypothetical protein
VRISANPGKVTHGSDASFSVSRSLAQSQPLTVNFSVGGTAALGSDYTLDASSGQVTIPAGQTSALIHMHAAATPPTTSRRITGKTVKLTLTPNSGYKMPKRGGKAATVKILAR